VAPRRAAALAPAIEALVCVRTAAGTDPADFAACLAAEPAVAQVWRVAADIDAVVRLACASLAELDAVVARMRHRGGAAQTVTYLVLPAGTEPECGGLRARGAGSGQRHARPAGGGRAGGAD
jgi:hypothetical protein